MADTQPDIAKIKRNIQRMIDAGAPEADIDQYVSGEGVSLEQLQAKTPPVAAQPNPDTSYIDQLTRQIGLTGRYAVEGITGLPAMLGDAANSTINLGIRGVNDVAGTEIPYLQKPTQMVQQGLEAVGAPKPESMTERIISYPSRALASIVPTGMLGNVAKTGPEAVQGLGQLADGMIPQAAGAVTGGVAQGATAEVTDNPILQFLAALGGGAIGGAVAGRMTAPAAEPIPSTGEVKASAKQAFKAAEDAQAILKPDPLVRLQQQVTQDAADFGYHPALQPRIGAVLQELERVSKDNITTKGMMTLRKIAQNAAKSTDPSEQALGSQIIGRIDDMMATLAPEDVLQGNADEAASAWAQGRDLWNQFRKSETVDKAMEKADRAAQSSGTGGNTDNALRQKIKAILDSDKLRRGFTSDEIGQMEAIVKGAPLTNAGRLVGRFSPTAGYLPAAFGVGSTLVGGGSGAVLPILGLLGKGYADRATRGAINDLSALIRSGGSYGPPPVNVAPPSVMGLLPSAMSNGGLLDFSPQRRQPALQ